MVKETCTVKPRVTQLPSRIGDINLTAKSLAKGEL